MNKARQTKFKCLSAKIHKLFLIRTMLVYYGYNYEIESCDVFYIYEYNCFRKYAFK